ncbi:thioredoxin [Alphaproteobacteria bacterium]|jgi:putative thioredoxin|nr:thioredoxin [Alphaproteobacteria bacterium]
MENNNIIDVNEIDFETKVLEASTKRLVVVDFWAPWCGPCKQLTPILEKIIASSPDKIILAKINIDENQQISAQLRIQSIPAVFAFKDKQPINAFQGVIPETEIINFLEKSLGEKLANNFEDFYDQIKVLLDEKKFLEAKDLLENFIAENTQEVSGICMYLESLIGLNEINLAEDFLNSLSNELVKTEKVKKIKDRIMLIKNTDKGPSLEKLKEDLENAPNNLDIVFKITDTHFANNNFDSCFDVLLNYYPKNKEKIKTKMLNYFDVLGFDHESTILYRKKLSSVMFS